MRIVALLLLLAVLASPLAGCAGDEPVNDSAPAQESPASAGGAAAEDDTERPAREGTSEQTPAAGGGNAKPDDR